MASFVKGALKTACLFNNNASASEGLRPQLPYRGSVTGPRWELHPPDQCAVRFSNSFRPCCDSVASFQPVLGV